jgi:hypothetical protein
MCVYVCVERPTVTIVYVEVKIPRVSTEYERDSLKVSGAL